MYVGKRQSDTFVKNRYRERAMLPILSEFVCLCSLSYPASKGHSCTILLSVACLAASYFSTLSHNRHDFRKSLVNIKCVLISSTNLSGVFLILRIIERDVIIHVKTSLHKITVILVRF
jgi:hypothetical protein